MRLPETVYNQVLRGMGIENAGISGFAHAEDDAARAATGECKRRSRRRRLEFPVRFLRHGALNAKPQTCTLVDLSRDGVCVMMDTVVAPGDQFVLYLPRGEESAPGESVRAQPLPILCTVRSSRLKQGGKFRTGAEFADAQEGEAERHLLVVAADGLSRRGTTGSVWARTTDRPDADPDAAVRRGDRQSLFVRAMMYVYKDDGKHGPMEQVEVRDYSETGVGILRVRPMAVGEQFVVRVPRPDEPPITRLCKVVNVALAGGRHRIGAQFIPFPGPNGRTFMSKLSGWIA
jgi:hypothetical protein